MPSQLAMALGGQLFGAVHDLVPSALTLKKTKQLEDGGDCSSEAGYETQR